MDTEILDVLKEIRDEAKATNSRLASVETEAKATNARLASVETEAKTTNARLASVETEAKTTNARLASVEQHLASVDEKATQTNVRLESLEGRVEFLERRTSKGLDGLTQELQAFRERTDHLARQQVESEIRLATEIVSLANVTREVRDLLSGRLDDHEMVLRHEERIKALETQGNGRKSQ